MIRVTPEKIEFPARNECILIGTNEAGIHGAGIAHDALKWGARLGQGFGHMSNCFGIPTKDWDIQTLLLEDIQFYVDRWIAWARLGRNQHWKWMVTKIGCGLAGYTPAHIAPLFKECKYMRNVFLPQEFWDIIGEPTPEEISKRKWSGELIDVYKD